jgi:ATP-dependent Clp protease adaptor protein ClpS
MVPSLRPGLVRAPWAVAARFPHASGFLAAGAAGAMPAEVEVEEPDLDETLDVDRPWVVLVWNDPINLMSYVTFVLQKVFGYSREKAERMMLEVHENGRSVVSNGTKEKAELDVFRLHEHGLWATMQQD